MLQNARKLLRQPIMNSKTRGKDTVILDGASLNIESLSLLGSGQG